MRYASPLGQRASSDDRHPIGRLSRAMGRASLSPVLLDGLAGTSASVSPMWKHVEAASLA